MDKRWIRIGIPAAMICSGAVFLAAGISRGEMDVVLRKAINICLECIGIG
jgi:hypothetical protein